jgi:putative SOS response-associated peptidase YedK
MSPQKPSALCRDRGICRVHRKNPNTGQWERTFAIITVPSNELVGQIHDRMPAILEPAGYERWLGLETDPHDLLITYPSEPMMLWPISPA